MAIYFLIATLPNLNAVELSQICQNDTSFSSSPYCSIRTTYGEVTNNGTFAGYIRLFAGGGIDTFINYGDITEKGKSYADTTHTIYWDSGYISSVINYGTMGGLGGSRGGIGATTPTSVTNYGKMKGVETGWGSANITISNYGVIDMLWTGATWYHFSNGGNYDFVLKDYAIIIQQNSDTFNNVNMRPAYGDNSHLIIKGGSVQHPVVIKFYDDKSKIILDFGGNFEFDKEYSLDRIIMKDNYWTSDTGTGTWSTHLSVPFSRLTTRSELYTLIQRGNNFIVNPADSKTAGYSTIGLLHKSNIKTMNSFYLQSNNVIYPHKHTKRKRTLQRRVIRKKLSSLRDSALAESWQSKQKIMDCFGESCDSPRKDEWVNSSLQSESNVIISSLRDEPLGSAWQSTNESSESKWIASGKALAMTGEGLIASYFANTHNDESLALQSNETFFYDSQSYLADTQRTRRTINTTNARNTNQSTNPNTNRSIRTTQSTQNNNYYFMLTPFVAHNYFFESGRYNLSGLEYGFITAFGGNISPSNYLGAHFAFSYGSLNDKSDKIFNITSSNMMVGLNYKFSMIWSMYLKARIDAFYFLNQVQSIAVTSGRVIKPNNLGFGASVAYGKEWDFGNGGILGLEVALDYKGLMSPSILTQNGGDATINESFSKAFYNMLYVDLGLNYDKYFESSVGKWGLDAGFGIKANATANALAKSNIRLNNIRDINMMLDNDMVLAYLNVGGSYLLNAKDFDMEFSLAYYGNYGDRTMSNGGGVEWRVNW